MNGPARLTAQSNPFSLRNFTSRSRCTSMSDWGCIPARKSAVVEIENDLHCRHVAYWPERHQQVLSTGLNKPAPSVGAVSVRENGVSVTTNTITR
jgi:hypothetical protein